jgi:hypothetical protein
VAVLDRGQRRHGVDEEEGRVAGGVDGAAHRADVAGDTGRGLVVDDGDGLDRAAVESSARRASIAAASTPERQSPGTNSVTMPSLLRHLLPQGGEVAGLEHQHAVAGRQGVDEGGFPRAGARAGEDDDRPLGAEHRLQTLQHLAAQAAEIGAAMVHGRPVDGAQHPVGHVARPRDLEEMAAGLVLGHGKRPLESPIALCIQSQAAGKRGGITDHEPDGQQPGWATPDWRSACGARREGDVLFDAASRGRYSTDASIYQIEPVGVRGAAHPDDVAPPSQIAREAGVPGAAARRRHLAVRPDGGRRAGRRRLQAPEPASRDRREARRARSSPASCSTTSTRCCGRRSSGLPGRRLDRAQATIGGMAGNNSCGSRSIRYGNMVHNVLAVDRRVARGRRALHRFGPWTTWRVGPPR